MSHKIIIDDKRVLTSQTEIINAQHVYYEMLYKTRNVNISEEN